MSYREKRIYRQHKPVKAVLTALAIVIATLVLLAVMIFFSFKKYIVYSDDGVRLEVPWLQETEETET